MNEEKDMNQEFQQENFGEQNKYNNKESNQNRGGYQNKGGKSKNRFNSEPPKYKVASYNGPIREGRVFMNLPLDKGVMIEDKHKKHFLFRDEEGNSKTDYKIYDGNFVIAKEDRDPLIRNVNEDFFYISKKDDGTLGFYTSIINRGKKTIGGDLELRNPANQKNFISINPINRYDTKGVGYRENSYSPLTPLSEEEINLHSQRNYETAFLINSVVEREMVDLNSSFFTNDIGKQEMSKYINDINSLFQAYREDQDIRYNSYEEIEENVTKFLKTPLVKTGILEMRNNYNKAYAEYREMELLCIVDRQEFINQYSFLDAYSEQDLNRYKELAEYKRKYDYYMDTDKEFKDEVIQLYENGYLDALKNVDYMALVEIDRDIKKNPRENTNKLREFNHLNDLIGEDNLKALRMKEDIEWYYNQNKGTLYPQLGPDSTFEDKKRYKHIMNQYKEELDYYSHLRKEDKFIEAQNNLKNYFSSEKINKMSNNLDELIKETNNIILKQEALISVLDKQQDPLYKEKVLTFDEKLKDYLDIIDPTPKEELFENLNVKEFYKNSKLLDDLEKLLLNHPENEYFKGEIDNHNYRHHKIEITGEDGLPGCTIMSNVKLTSMDVERGMKLFGVVDNWDFIKENNEGLTVRDKYVFLEKFNDIGGIKKMIHDAEFDREDAISTTYKHLDGYKKLINEDEKKLELKEIAHLNAQVDLWNERIDFLHRVMELQQPFISEEERKDFEKGAEKHFHDYEDFIESPQESYERYRCLGESLRENIDEIEYARLRVEKDPSQDNLSLLAANEKAFVDLVNRHKVLSDFLEVNQKDVYREYLEIKQAIYEADVDSMEIASRYLSETDKERLKIRSLREQINNSKSVNVITSIDVDLSKSQPLGVGIVNTLKENELARQAADVVDKEHMTYERFENKMKEVEEKVQALEEKFKDNRDVATSNQLAEAKEELELYKDEDFNSLGIVISDEPMYSVKAFDQGDLHQEMRNIIDYEKNNGWKTTTRDLLEELAESYDARANKTENIENLANIYIGKTNKDIDLNNLNKDEYRELGNWALDIRRDAKEALELVDRLQEETLLYKYDHNEIYKAIQENKNNIDLEYVELLDSMTTGVRDPMEINQKLLEAKEMIQEVVDETSKGIDSLRLIEVPKENERISIKDQHIMLDTVKQEAIIQYIQELDESVYLSPTRDNEVYHQGMIMEDEKIYNQIEKDGTEKFIDNGILDFNADAVEDKTTLREFGKEL